VDGPVTPSGVIFDHDGTLVDSLQVVVAATNRVLADHGYPLEQPKVIIAAMVHPTAPRMGRHAGIDDPAVQRRLAADFCLAARAIGTGHASLYAGVDRLVRALALRGHPLGVVSNNDGVFVRQVMGEFGIAPHFAAIYGEEDMPAPKPDPRGLVKAAAAIGREPAACIYVGDSGGDAVAAHAAGMRAVGVTWGIHTRAEMEAMGFDWLIERPEDLPALLR
jgi:2-phosphoglycolate phosphatase